jgi:murein DD-endopeptidase MepM/ murein hydrolase activator NlpD
MQGKDAYDTTSVKPQNTKNYSNITNKKSVEDSIFRKDIENRDRYNLSVGGEGYNSNASIRNYFFFTPLKGLITNNFNTALGHYGIDIVAKENEPVKSVLDGTVILSDWTVKTGYVIAIQHQSNIISVYKHNSVLMKKEGEHVKAGDVIAIIGNTGELSSGPHLHFELWHDGKPVNPLDYMRF